MNFLSDFLRKNTWNFDVVYNVTSFFLRFEPSELVLKACRKLVATLDDGAFLDDPHVFGILKSFGMDIDLDAITVTRFYHCANSVKLSEFVDKKIELCYIFSHLWLSDSYKDYDVETIIYTGLYYYTRFCSIKFDAEFFLPKGTEQCIKDIANEIQGPLGNTFDPRFRELVITCDDEIRYLQCKGRILKSPFDDDDETVVNEVNDAGDIKLLNNLGSGSFGEVYKLDNSYCVKINKVGGYCNLREVLREVHISCRVSQSKYFLSEEIVSFYRRKVPFLGLKMKTFGRALDQRIFVENEPFSECEIGNIMMQLLKALRFLHQNNIVHCDVKSGNILLDDDGFVKIIDFGMSHKEGVYVDSELYTPCYRPKEQMGEHCCARSLSDIWALSCVYYDLLAGDYLFSRKSVNDNFVKIEMMLDAYQKKGVYSFFNRFGIKRNLPKMFWDMFKDIHDGRLSAVQLLNKYFEEL